MLTQEKLTKISLLILEIEDVKEWDESSGKLQVALEAAKITLIKIKQQLQQKAGILP